MTVFAARVARGRRIVARHPLVTFLVLAVTLSWAYWVPLALRGGSGSHVPGLLGPAVAAVLTAGLAEGRTGVVRLLGGLTRWRAPLRLYALAVAPLAAGGIALTVLVLLGRPWPDWTSLAAFDGLPGAAWPVVFALVFVLNGIGEELGWRGYAWPRVRRGRSLGRAALVMVGPIAVWHLPAFWLDSGLRDLGLATLPGWILGLAAGCVVLGWLYERSGGSVLLPTLMHTSLNMASATEATAGPSAVAASMVFIVVAIRLLQARSRRGPGGVAGGVSPVATVPTGGRSGARR